MEYTRTFAIEPDSLRIRSGGDGRTVEAYAAVFNTPTPVSDQDGKYIEEIDPRAFDRAIERAKRTKGGWNIPVMFNHGMTIFQTPSEIDSGPIGVVEEISADKRGLFTRARYHDSTRARDVLEMIREGSITAYSFRGRFDVSKPEVPRRVGFQPDSQGNLKTVRRMESTLLEFGPATFPVYAGAEVVAVRAEDVASIISRMASPEVARLATVLTSGTHHDLSEVGTLDEESGLVTEDLPEGALRSATPKEQIMRNYAAFIRTRSA